MRRLVPCPACNRHIFVDESVEVSHFVDGRAACPHCGTKEVGGLAIFVVAASMGLAACNPPPVAVYGPAPEPSDARTTSSGSTLPTASNTAPVQGPVAVYGPPPINPDQRSDAGPIPSAPATSSTVPTAKPLAHPPTPPAPIYGPPPLNPDQRSGPPPSVKP